MALYKESSPRVRQSSSNKWNDWEGPEYNFYAKMPAEYPFLETKLPGSMAHYKTWTNSGPPHSLSLSVSLWEVEEAWWGELPYIPLPPLCSLASLVLPRLPVLLIP